MDVGKATLIKQSDSLRRGLQACHARLAAVEAELATAESRHIVAEGYLTTLMDERDALAAQNVRLREALERATDAAKSYRSDILGCSGDNPNPRNESWMEGMCYAPKWEGRDSSIDIAVAALAFPLPQAARDVTEWRRDSERYRYIRTASLIHWEEGEKHNRISWPTIYAAERIAGGNYRDRFDAAIDAAIDAARGVK